MTEERRDEQPQCLFCKGRVGRTEQRLEAVGGEKDAGKQRYIAPRSWCAGERVTLDTLGKVTEGGDVVERDRPHTEMAGNEHDVEDLPDPVAEAADGH